MKYLLLFFWGVLFCKTSVAQAARPDSAAAVLMDFVSDTQQPLGVEKIYLKPAQNTRATAMIFSAILRDKPAALFMLGDIVSLGYRNKKWIKTDRFLDSAKRQGTKVYGLMGNHDVMARDKKGENNFQKRFPAHNRTGYLQVIDSIALVLLNSNFSKLSVKETDRQQQWYIKTIDSLNHHAGIKGIIVACHHPIFTNSNMVKPSATVRQQFLTLFMATPKCVLFITGHAHAFEHFRYQQKDFLVIGGGGGLHQPLSAKANMPADIAAAYKPMFHYLQLRRYGSLLQLRSYHLAADFSTFTAGYSAVIATP
ncbi:MAG: metallophosphoesterase [Chitinophagaceae bacterium]